MQKKSDLQKKLLLSSLQSRHYKILTSNKITFILKWWHLMGFFFFQLSILKHKYKTNLQSANPLTS